MPVPMKNGKDYYTVVERMDMLLKEQGKENYSLNTDVKYESGIVIVRAVLILYSKGVSDVEILEGSSRCYTGHALGELGKAKTLEATETHAIGRALSSAGWFGSEFASANEMEEWEKPKIIPEVNLKDQEVKVDMVDFADKISRPPLPNGTKENSDWDGSEIVYFGKYRNNSGDKSKNITWSKLPDDYLTADWWEKMSNADLKDKCKWEIDRRNNV